ncbi:MAG TPA: DUF2948 family protein [Xanthobacteraceae bacterium]|jgi:hypothetical protein|nr:DUF2948 family protein [Xanthobacteraceae bacterium]
MDLLRLNALDKDDLEVISAHLQDAIVNVSDIIWRPSERRVVIGLNRFDWVGAQESIPENRRRLAALRFDCVKSFKSRDIDPAAKAVTLSLLAVDFADTDVPAGQVTLTFSGGGAVRLEVECLEAELADLGPAWTTASRPGHPDESVA